MQAAEPADTQWRPWIGRQEVTTASLDVEIARRFALAIGSSTAVESATPRLAHWAYFATTTATEQLGVDGHPPSGAFLPPIGLPRRMFAGADIAFRLPLRLGEPAELTTTILAVRQRNGREGPLVFLDLERRVAQEHGLCLLEYQTLAYCGPRPSAPVGVTVGDPTAGTSWRPSSVDLFRFSAATFNSHRIHYDQDYAAGGEGYPNLVVHGPFTAAKLLEFAAGDLRTPLRHFACRAQAPLFLGDAVSLVRGDDAGLVAAIRPDGRVAMTATVGA